MAYAGGWWWWEGSNPARPEHRVGSYAQNNWLSGHHWWGYSAGAYNQWANFPEPFRVENEITDSSRTPLFADGIHWWWGGGGNWWGQVGDGTTDNRTRATQVSFQ